MKKKLDKLFTKEDRDRIISSVQAVEGKSSGEILPMIVESSSSYHRVELRGALALTAFVTAAVLIPWITVATSGLKEPAVISLSWLMPAAAALLAVVAVAGMAVRMIPALRNLLVPAQLKRQRAFEAAQMQFYNQGVYNTRDNTGILIYISIRERQVVILADSGINDKVSPDTWQKQVDHITAGIHQKKGARALCEAIESCSELLVEHFPVKHDDTNELSDLVIE